MVDSSTHSRGFIKTANGDTAVKADEGIKSYGIDWSPFLNGDTITTSTWTLQSGITLVTESNTTSIALVTISGGTLGTTYTVKNTIVTAGGTTEVHTFYIQVGVQ